VISMTESRLFLMQCHLRALRSRASNIDFPLCLLHTEVSRFSEYFDELFRLEHYSAIASKYVDVYIFLLGFFCCKLLNLCPSLPLRDSASLRCSFYTQSRSFFLVPLAKTGKRSFISLLPTSFEMC